MSTLAELLLNWYALNGRKLPWRDRPDPYEIWISEIMLQQTRVDTVINYYEKWMRKFPCIADLAGANENEVLIIWEGLGYYSRARNLHHAAQIIIEKYGGKLPESIHELIQLPGIGRYTAGAIASIAFKADEPTVDSNIKRVISRIYDIDECVETAKGEKLLWTLLRQELPKGKAGDFNQALMDLGTLICTPKNPFCNTCPLNCICQAKTRGVQEERPVLKPRILQPLLYFSAAVIRKEEKVLLAKRPSRGLLGGLWEFPNEQDVNDYNDQGTRLKQTLLNRFCINSEIISQLGIYKHTYTHFRQIMKVYNGKYISGMVKSGDISWVAIDEFSNYPMGKIFKMISKALLTNEEYRFKL